MDVKRSVFTFVGIPASQKKSSELSEMSSRPTRHALLSWSHGPLAQCFDPDSNKLSSTPVLCLLFIALALALEYRFSLSQGCVFFLIVLKVRITVRLD